jgi:hypothetical protein
MRASRREFSPSSALVSTALLTGFRPVLKQVMTVKRLIWAKGMGTTLIDEHLYVIAWIKKL